MGEGGTREREWRERGREGERERERERRGEERRIRAIRTGRDVKMFQQGSRRTGREYISDIKVE